MQSAPIPSIREWIRITKSPSLMERGLASQEGPSQLWYAVYGSNLLRSRFRRYLERCPEGAQELGDMPFRVPFRLYFAYQRSETWGPGGVAFVGLERIRPAPTLGRAYLLTIGQFSYVVGGENGRQQPIPVTVDMIRNRSWVQIEEARRYDILLPIDPTAARPVVTLTGRNDISVPRSLPGSAYTKAIRSGLIETWPDMAAEEIDNYISRFSTEI